MQQQAPARRTCGRGYLFGVAAAHDAPPGWSAPQALFLLPTQHWALRFDPQSAGDKGPTARRWYTDRIRTAWTQLRGPHTRPWSDIPEVRHPGAAAYAGVGWYSADIALDSSLIGDGPWVLATAGAAVSAMRVWVDG